MIRQKPKLGGKKWSNRANASVSADSWSRQTSAFLSTQQAGWRSSHTHRWPQGLGFCLSFLTLGACFGMRHLFWAHNWHGRHTSTTERVEMWVETYNSDEIVQNTVKFRRESADATLSTEWTEIHNEACQYPLITRLYCIKFIRFYPETFTIGGHYPEIARTKQINQLQSSFTFTKNMERESFYFNRPRCRWNRWALTLRLILAHTELDYERATTPRGPQNPRTSLQRRYLSCMFQASDWADTLLFWSIQQSTKTTWGQNFSLFLAWCISPPQICRADLGPAQKYWLMKDVCTHNGTGSINSHSRAERLLTLTVGERRCNTIQSKFMAKGGSVNEACAHASVCTGNEIYTTQAAVQQL